MSAGRSRVAGRRRRLGLRPARPLWVRVGGAPGIGRNLEASASGLDLFTVFGLFFFLAVGLVAGRGVREARRARRAARRAARARRGRGPRARAPRLFLRPDAFLGCGVALFVGAFFALRGSARGSPGLRVPGDRVLPRPLLSAPLHLRPDEHVLQAVPRGVAPLRDRDAVLVFRRGDARHRRPLGLSRRGVLAALLAAAALFTSVTAGRAAVSRHFAPVLGPVARRPAVPRDAPPRRGARGRVAAAQRPGNSGPPRGAGALLPGLRPDLDADGAADGPRLGLPRQAARKPRDARSRRAARRSETMYSDPDGRRASRRCSRRYHVGYVYVGWLERKTYPAAGLQKFRTSRDLFELVYENPETQIYRVVGGPTRGRDPAVPRSAARVGRGRRRRRRTSPRSGPRSRRRRTAGEPPFSKLREPRGAAVDGEDRVWIADFGHSRLRVFDADGGFLGGWGGRGGGEFGFKELCGVAIRGDDALRRRHVERPRPGLHDRGGSARVGGRALRAARHRRRSGRPRLGHRTPATTASSPTTASSRTAVSTASADRRRASSRAPSASPSSPSGSVYVADAGNQRIQILGTDGEPRGSFPFPGWAGNAEPDLVVDVDGTIYATDPTANAVVVLDRGRRREAADRVRRVRADKLALPTGVAIDRKTRILLRRQLRKRLDLEDLGSTRGGAP